MKKYEELVKFIIKNIGGKNNILNVTHCVTRLRFQLKDESKANDDALKNNSGIITVMHSAGQYQVVIGNHVADVYSELVNEIGVKESQEPSQRKMKIKEKALDLISGIFMPSLSLLCACGMIKGLNIIFSFVGLYTQESDLYLLINAIGDCFFYFFPIVIGYNTAKKINMNPYTGMIIGAALCYPTINGVDLNFFGLNLNATYTSTVLPVIITCFLAAPIEKFLNKVLPSVIRSFMTPTIVLLVSVTVGFILIGPIVNAASQGISDALLAVYALSPVLAGILFATLWQVFVIFGVHITFIVLCMMNLSMGIPDPLLGSQVFVAFATSAVVLAIFIRTKNKELRSACIPAFISSIFGIPEPALYGITITRPVMFAVSCIGSGISGAISGFLGFRYYQMAGIGLLEIPALLPTTNTGTVLLQVVICMIITFVITFVLAFVLYKENTQPSSSQPSPSIEETSKSYGEISSPIKGEVKPLSAAKDDAFATGALGKGCVIMPEEGKVYSPFDGTVLVMFPTGHAIGLVDDKGCEILIHVGINTVQLGGKHFFPKVKIGDKVKKGQFLLEFDLEAIKEEGYDTDTIVVVSNSKDYSEVSLSKEGEIVPQDCLLTVKG